MRQFLDRQPSLPYVAPFVVFLLLLALQRYSPFGPLADNLLWIALLSAVLWFCSRHVIDLRIKSAVPSLCLGVLIFLIWIAPDVLLPSYRDHWWFQNSMLGVLSTVAPAPVQMNPAVLVLRALRAVLIVPVIEELFWRAWLMRWLISMDFRSVRLGTYSAWSFWITALLFASEHGPYWDVGLLAGVLYNWWMLRTRSLGDCILAHAVTNGCLCAYVIAGQHWQYWL